MERCPCGDEHFKDHPWKCLVCGKTTCGGCGCHYCDSCLGFTCKDCFDQHNKIHNIISKFEECYSITSAEVDEKAISTVHCDNCQGIDFKVARFGQDTKLTCSKCGNWRLFQHYE